MAQSKWRGFNIPSYHAPVDMRGTVWDACTKFGCNHFRVQIIDPSQTTHEWGIAQYMAWLNGQLDNVDAAVAAAEELGSKIIIDMHSPVGGRFMNVMNKPRDYVFSDSTLPAVFVDCWELIAERYKHSRAVLGFDLINEPAARSGRDVVKLQLRAARAIRKITERKKIIFSTKHGSYNDLGVYQRKIDQIKALSPVWLTAHFYWPMSVTHQGIGCSNTPPLGSALYPTSKVNKQGMHRQLKKLRTFQRDHHIPIYIGEFSCTRWSGYPTCDNRFNWLKDAMQVFESYNWRYAYHAFNEAVLWDLERPFLPCPDPCDAGCAPPKVWTTSAELVRSFFERNK